MSLNWKRFIFMDWRNIQGLFVLRVEFIIVQIMEVLILQKMYGDLLDPVNFLDMIGRCILESVRVFGCAQNSTTDV